MALPRLVAFDLDDTVWTPEMWELSGPPFTRARGGGVRDRSGTVVRVFDGALTVLRELHADERWRDTAVAWASRTEYPEWAFECLGLFEVAPGVTLQALGAHAEIYPGNKRAHFTAFANASGLELSDMLFFDNEFRNVRDVGNMGVTAIYTPDGMTVEAWEEGLQAFAANAAAREDEE